jgi:hypothetical protein
MCVGEYTVQTDDVRTHISCSAYTAPTLACIAEGISKFSITFLYVLGFCVVDAGEDDVIVVFDAFLGGVFFLLWKMLLL